MATVRKNYLVFTVKGKIEIDTTNPESFSKATTAVNAAVSSLAEAGGEDVVQSSKIDRI